MAMAEDGGRSRLGRGLAALMGDVGDEGATTERVRTTQRRVPIEYLRANPRNPRRHFAESELEELAGSIRERGVIQPIVVRSVAGVPNAFEIIAGERRWRASQRAGLHDVPIVVLEVTDREAMEIAIIENVQRADLNPIEEALGYQSLIDLFSYTQNDLAKVIGKSRSHVANTVRLLRLPESVKTYLAEGKLTAGHARALLTHDDPERLARAIVEQGMNVREVEAIGQVKAEVEGKTAVRRPRGDKDADTLALEKHLSDVLGLGVALAHRGEGGELRIRYASLEQLDELCRKLGAN